MAPTKKGQKSKTFQSKQLQSQTSRVAKQASKGKRKHKTSSRKRHRRKKGPAQTPVTQIDENKFHGCYLFCDNLSAKTRRAKATTYSAKGEDPYDLYVGQFTNKPQRRQRQHRREVKGGAAKTRHMQNGIIVALIRGFNNIVDALQFEYAWNRFVRQKKDFRKVPWKCPEQKAIQQVHQMYPKKNDIRRALGYLEAVFADVKYQWTQSALPVGHESRNRGFDVYIMNHPIVASWTATSIHSLRLRFHYHADLDALQKEMDTARSEAERSEAEHSGKSDSVDSDMDSD